MSSFTPTPVTLGPITSNGPDPEPDCGTYDMANRTNKFVLYEGYAGIPENLIINVIAWVVLLVLFALLRKIAWDYGRIALVSRNEEKRPDADSSASYNVWTSLFYGEHDRNSLIGSQESLDTHLHIQDKGFCAWIPAFFRVKDADILQKSGRDALQYLSFQRYLLVYMTIICVLSTAVVIPVNFSGSNVGNATDFGHTTIANLDSDSPLLWVHAILAVVYLIIAVYFMRHFSVNLEFDEDEQVSRTLMISSIPKDMCFKSSVQQHFQEAYPETAVSDIQFAYNISKLVRLDKQRQVAAEAKMNSDIEYKKTGELPNMRPYKCGECFCCDTCGCKQVDAIEYYTEEEKLLQEECEKEKVTAYQDPLGMAFVTFQTDNMAERVRADFRITCKGAHNPLPSSVYTDLNIQEWRVNYAPSPENIYWENLSFHGWKWWLRAVIINCILVVLLFFLTTPSIIMTTLDQINYKKALNDLHNAVLSQFLPTVLLWIFTAILPNIVYYSDQYIGHWTRTAEHHSIMRKTYFFLLLMVLLLPSLGLTSAKALFEWFILDNQHNYRWKCIFLSGNGAFFVNYIITSAFIGTALELMRFSELFMYVVRLLLARSSAEKTAVRKSVVWEFQFGCQYAWLLCVFAVIVSYSILCPLIAPFGLVYLGLKHIVDRYNIYFAYKSSRINKHIHATAVNFVAVSVILLQFTIVFFTALRTDALQPVFVFSAVALFITLIFFFGRICFGWFKNLGPLKYKQFGEGDNLTEQQEAGGKPFVANVLLESESSGKGENHVTLDVMGTNPSYGYGAMDTAGSVNHDADNSTALYH